MLNTSVKCASAAAAFAAGESHTFPPASRKVCTATFLGPGSPPLLRMRTAPQNCPTPSPHGASVSARKLVLAAFTATFSAFVAACATSFSCMFPPLRKYAARAELRAATSDMSSSRFAANQSLSRRLRNPHASSATSIMTTRQASARSSSVASECASHHSDIFSPTSSPNARRNRSSRSASMLGGLARGGRCTRAMRPVRSTSKTGMWSLSTASEGRTRAS